MSLTAFISSSLPYSGAVYLCSSSIREEVFINVVNNGNSPVRLKEVYLVDNNKPPAVSLGIPQLKRRGVSYAPANNVVPAATTTTITGTINIPSGSGDTSLWLALPFQQKTNITIEDLELYENIGNRGLNAVPQTPELAIVLRGQTFIETTPVPSPVFSGSTQYTAAVNYQPQQYAEDIFGESTNAGVFGILYSEDPAVDSLANVFTYEWWSYLRSYGIPYYPGAQLDTTAAGTVWKTDGFNDFGAEIGYTVDGKLYVILSEDIEKFFEGQVDLPLPPYAGLTSSAVVPLNQWVHQAVTRDSSNNVNIWINGTSSGGSVSTGSHGVDSFRLFYDSPIFPYIGTGSFAGFPMGVVDGWFVEMNFWNTNKYTGSFVPPTAAVDPAFSFGGGVVPVTSSTTTPGLTSYPALFVAQQPAIQYFPSNTYDFQLGGVVFTERNQTIEATSSFFRVTSSVLPPE